MMLLSKAVSQEEQMEYVRSLRMLKAGWTTELRTAYFEWFLKAANYRGGASFERFMQIIRDDAVANLSESEKETLKVVLAKTPEKKSALEAMGEIFAGRTSMKEWTMEDLAPLLENRSSSVGLKNRNFETGRQTFSAVGCFACHRFGNDGGMTGPDLTSAGRRYTAHDLLDQILNPSKEINEQFQPITITKKDGDTISGVIVNLNGDTIRMNTDPSSPKELAIIDRKEVASIEPSKTSLMPGGLLNVLTQEEILDLLAYILSGGDSKDRMFTKR